MGDYERTLREHGYKLGECVGKGSTSDCFFLTHKNFPGMRFIAKIITGLDDKSKEAFARIFQEEVNILTHIDHPNIVRCYDYFCRIWKLGHTPLMSLFASKKENFMKFYKLYRELNSE